MSRRKRMGEKDVKERLGTRETGRAKRNRVDEERKIGYKNKRKSRRKIEREIRNESVKERKDENWKE